MPTSTVVTIEGNTTNLSTSNHIAYISKNYRGGQHKDLSDKFYWLNLVVITPFMYREQVLE